MQRKQTARESGGKRRPPVTEEKLVVLHALRAMEPLDENQLLSFFANNDIMGYIDMKLALVDMFESGLLIKVGNSEPSAYMLAAYGREAHDLFIKRVPASRLEQVDQLALTWKDKLHRQEQVRATYVCEPPYQHAARLTIFEHSEQQMELTLAFPDKEQAMNAVRALDKNAETLYATIWRALGD